MPLPSHLPRFCNLFFRHETRERFRTGSLPARDSPRSAGAGKTALHAVSPAPGSSSGSLLPFQEKETCSLIFGDFRFPRLDTTQSACLDFACRGIIGMLETDNLASDIAKREDRTFRSCLVVRGMGILPEDSLNILSPCRWLINSRNRSPPRPGRPPRPDGTL